MARGASSHRLCEWPLIKTHHVMRWNHHHCQHHNLSYKLQKFLLHPRSACCTVRGTCSSHILHWPIANAWPACGKVWPKNGQEKAPHRLEIWKIEGPQRQCRSPEIHTEQPCWGAFYDPNTGLQKQWPLRWTESGVPRGSMQVAVNRLHEASGPAWQDAESHAPTLHPRASPFAHQRFLWCTWGSNSTLREFVCRHSSCLLTKRGSRQHTCRPERTKISKMLSVQHADPGVPNSLLKGFPYTPHTPPLWHTSRAQMRQQRHQPLKTLRVGMQCGVPERYGISSQLPPPPPAPGATGWG